MFFKNLVIAFQASVINQEEKRWLLHVGNKEKALLLYTTNKTKHLTKTLSQW